MLVFFAGFFFVTGPNKLSKSEASEWLHGIRAVVHFPQIALETSGCCSLCFKMSMKMLMDPNSDRWCFSMVSVSIRKEDNCEYFCLFDIFHHDTYQILLTRHVHLFYKLNNNKSQLLSLRFILYIYCTVVPSTTNVFAGLCESRQRPTGCSTWLLLNRSPTGSTVATLVLLSVTVCLL